MKYQETVVKTKKIVAAPPVVKKTPNKFRSVKFASYKTPLWAWKWTTERFIFRSRPITPLWVNFKVLTSRLILLFKTTWNQISILCNFFKQQIHHSLKHRTAWNPEIWKKNCNQIKKNIFRAFFLWTLSITPAFQILIITTLTFQEPETRASAS